MAYICRDWVNPPPSPPGLPPRKELSSIAWAGRSSSANPFWKGRPRGSPVGVAGGVPSHGAAFLAALGPQQTHHWVALVALRYAALGGFKPSQARPLQAPLAGAALVALVGLDSPTRLQELVA